MLILGDVFLTGMEGGPVYNSEKQLFGMLIPPLCQLSSGIEIPVSGFIMPVNLPISSELIPCKPLFADDSYL